MYRLWCRLVGGDAAGGPFDPALSVIATNPPTHPLSPPTLSSHKYKHKYKYKCKCNRRNTISPTNPTLLLNNSKTNTSTIFLAHPHIVSLFLLQNTLATDWESRHNTDKNSLIQKILRQVNHHISSHCSGNHVIDPAHFHGHLWVPS